MAETTGHDRRERSGSRTDHQIQTYYPSGGTKRLRVIAFPATTKARGPDLSPPSPTLANSRHFQHGSQTAKTQKRQNTHTSGFRGVILCSRVAPTSRENVISTSSQRVSAYTASHPNRPQFQYSPPCDSTRKISCRVLMH